MLINIENLLTEIKDQQKELRTSELNMLINQINPHFLYNTLDTIYMLARINKEETTMKMIQALSKYLRLSLSKGNDIVTVADELENVRSYLQIQEIRNENLFTYTVDCEVEPEKTYVLKLILQPLVENAIKYGFREIYEGGIIAIRIYRDGGIYCLWFTITVRPLRRIWRKNQCPERKNAFRGKEKLSQSEKRLRGCECTYQTAFEIRGQRPLPVPGGGERHNMYYPYSRRRWAE